jgi:hypothetical protein
VKTPNTLAGGPGAITAQLARATEIATVLSGSGLGWLVQAVGLRGCVWPRCRLVCAVRPDRKCPHHLGADVSLPDRLRLTLERFGPAFVRAGQMLALRPDHIPLDYAEALRGLHADAEPFAAAEAAAIVEAELGAGLPTAAHAAAQPSDARRTLAQAPFRIPQPRRRPAGPPARSDHQAAPGSG